MLPQVMPPQGVGNRTARKPFVAPMQPPVGSANDLGTIRGGPVPQMRNAAMPPAPTLSASAGGGSIGMPPSPGLSSSAAGGSIGMPPAPMSATSTGSAPGITPAAPAMATTGSPRRGVYGADNAPPGGMRPPVPAPPGTTNPAWGPQDGVSPFNASSGATGIGDFQRFSDAAYERQAGRLTPQFEAQERSFEQDMVNRGIAPGTPAYDNARANFENARNDAFAGARTQADQLGAALQNQSFQQGATNSGLLNQLLLGQMGADASRFGATTSANASMRNAQTQAQSEADRLRFQSQQGDFQNLMQLLGFSQGATGFNNSAIGQNNAANSGWMGQNQNLLGMFQGGGTPNNIDVTGPYNNQYNAQSNQAYANQQQQNANNQMYAQMFASLYCDRNAKDEIAPASPESALEAITGIPLAIWSYKADAEQVPHIGTYAQDFNKTLGLPANLHISPIDLFGALIGSVQALSAKVKELEAA